MYESDPSSECNIPFSIYFQVYILRILSPPPPPKKYLYKKKRNKKTAALPTIKKKKNFGFVFFFKWCDKGRGFFSPPPPIKEFNEYSYGIKTHAACPHNNNNNYAA